MKYRVPMYLRTIDIDEGYVIVEADSEEEARRIAVEDTEFDEIVWDERPEQVNGEVELDPFEPVTLVEE
jgi:hypothetical protein